MYVCNYVSMYVCIDRLCVYIRTVQDDDPNQRLLIEAIKDDSLSKIEREEQRRAEQTILNAAKLIAPVIEGSFASGFDW